VPDLTAILVTHCSAREIGEAVASLRRAFQAESAVGEIIVVDCASPEPERAPLSDLPVDRLVLLPDNRGYSGGLNAGLSAARSRNLLLANADVVFGEGSLGPLLSAIEDRGVGAAAPRLSWDEEGRIWLPPGWEPGFFRDVGEALAGKFPRLDRRRFARWAREAFRLWREGGEVGQLTGAVLATRKDVFDRVGRFDEAYAFEYEETEWEDRVRRAGYRLRYVPCSRMRHLYARSAVRNPETAGRRAASRRLYRRRRYGRAGAALLDRLEHVERQNAPADVLEARCLPARTGAAAAISPNRSMLPFAGALLDRDLELPEELLGSFGDAALYVRLFETARGTPLETYLWRTGA
jgi:GT2 family glycosyltransferase